MLSLLLVASFVVMIQIVQFCPLGKSSGLFEKEKGVEGKLSKCALSFLTPSFVQIPPSRFKVRSDRNDSGRDQRLSSDMKNQSTLFLLAVAACGQYSAALKGTAFSIKAEAFAKRVAAPKHCGLLQKTLTKQVLLRFSMILP